MTEHSMLWTGTVTGDHGPYNQASLALLMEYMLLGNNGATEGVLPQVLNELAVTSAGGTVIQIDTGAAVLKGLFYYNDAAKQITLSAPAVLNPRVDRVVLQADYTAQTVRIAVLTGTVAGVAPAVTQTAATLWEISLARVSITPGGAVTIARDFEYTTAKRTPFVRRVGGDPDDWSTQGSDLFRIGAFRAIPGRTDVTTAGGEYQHYTAVGIKWSDYFAYKPIVLVTLEWTSVSGESYCPFYTYDLITDDIQVGVIRTWNTGSHTFQVHWLLLGPPAAAALPVL